MKTIVKNGITYEVKHDEPYWDQPRGGFGSEYWEVYSPKMQRDVKLNSNLERDHWLMLEADPNVIAFCEQPIRFLAQAGESGTSIIDIWVLFADKSEEYRELKLRSDVNSKRSAKQIEIQKNWCERNDCVHRVVTELDLLQFKTLIKNCSEYIGFIPHTITSQHKNLQQSVLDIVRQIKSIQINELIKNLVDIGEQQVLSAVFTLIHSGHLYAGLDTKKYSRTLPLSIRR